VNQCAASTKLWPARKGVKKFQNYALRKTPKAEIARRVGEAATMLGLEPYLGRKPGALSGGQDLD
jgi:ABC-type sugar transport system ATPase subunit